MGTGLVKTLSSVFLAGAMMVSAGKAVAYEAPTQLMNCDIKIKGVFSGTPVNVVITVYDVSWAECLALKAAVVLATPKK